jgi:hypothetical protein
MLFRSFRFKTIKISSHSIERAFERTTIKTRSELATLAFESLEEGIDVLGDPTLREMCYRNAVKNHNCGTYAHKGIVFIFREDILVTVYPMSWLADFNKHGDLDHSRYA